MTKKILVYCLLLMIITSHLYADNAGSLYSSGATYYNKGNAALDNAANYLETKFSFVNYGPMDSEEAQRYKLELQNYKNNILVKALSEANKAKDYYNNAYGKWKDAYNASYDDKYNDARDKAYNMRDKCRDFVYDLEADIKGVDEYIIEVVAHISSKKNEENKLAERTSDFENSSIPILNANSFKTLITDYTSDNPIVLCDSPTIVIYLNPEFIYDHRLLGKMETIQNEFRDKITFHLFDGIKNNDIIGIVGVRYLPAVAFYTPTYINGFFGDQEIEYLRDFITECLTRVE
jgi:hypothetical protein